MSPRLRAASFPIERLGEAVIALASALGLHRTLTHFGQPPAGSDARALKRWLEALESALQLELQPIEPSLDLLGAAVSQGLPKIALVATEPARATSGLNADRVLVILRARWGKLTLLAPDGRRVAVDMADVVEAISRPAIEAAAHDLEPFLDMAKVPAARRPRARRALLADALEEQPIAQLFRARIAAAAPIRQQAQSAGLPRLVALFTAAFAGAQLLNLLSWWIIGKGTFSGHLEAGWLTAWTLVLFSSAALLQASSTLQGRFTIGAARLLKTRLLRGSLSVDPDLLKHEGIGHQIGRVIEADTFEQLSLNGGFLAGLALFQILGAAAVFALGPSAVVQVAALAGWGAITAATSLRFAQARRRWSTSALRLTHDAVERMVGNRTRILQQPEALWHDEEDHDLAAILPLAAAMDRRETTLRTVIPRGWLAVGLASLLPAAIARTLPPEQLSVGLGGVLLAYGGFYMLSQSLAQLLQARVSWLQVRDLFHAGAEPPATRRAVIASNLVIAPNLVSDESSSDTDDTSRESGPSLASDAPLPRGDGEGPEPALLDASGLRYHYPDRTAPVLAGCSFTIGARDRILLTGPSGGGKSTLASLLAGLRAPAEGSVLLDGLDRHTLGKAEWRRRVVLVPQFHDNHVFNASFAFNLLVGRRWPAHDDDYRAAEAVCQGLGLGALLERMPGGLLEMVGEAGWRLSHGERSRMFVARAILQSPRLLILDESFGALDPRNVLRCLSYVTRQACGLVLIAHP